MNEKNSTLVIKLNIIGRVKAKLTKEAGLTYSFPKGIQMLVRKRRQGGGEETSWPETNCRRL